MLKYFKELYKENPMEIEVSAPAVISEIAILKDSVDGKVFLRNLITNVGSKKIIAISISIKLFDVFGEIIISEGEEEMNYIYQDMVIAPAKYWGNKIAIELPENTRKVKVHIDKIIFNDSSIWNSDLKDTVILQEQEEMNYSEEFYKLVEETDKERLFFYVENNSCWQCTCGKPNHLETEICGYCGRTKEFVKENYSKDNLEPKYDSFLKKKKEEEEIAKAKKEELRRINEEKRKKEEEERHEQIRKRNEEYWAAVKKEEAEKKAEEEANKKKKIKKIKKIIIGIAILFLVLLVCQLFQKPSIENSSLDYESDSNMAFKEDSDKICSFIGRNLNIIKEEQLLYFGLFGETPDSLDICSFDGEICELVKWSKKKCSNEEFGRMLEYMIKYYGEPNNKNGKDYIWTNNIGNLTRVELRMYPNSSVFVFFQ